MPPSQKNALDNSPHQKESLLSRFLSKAKKYTKRVASKVTAVIGATAASAVFAATPNVQDTNNASMQETPSRHSYLGNGIRHDVKSILADVNPDLVASKAADKTQDYLGVPYLFG